MSGRRAAARRSKTKSASPAGTEKRALAPATRFREELEDYMSEDYAVSTLRSITTWGRYGELFAYDESSQSFSLENPQ